MDHPNYISPLCFTSIHSHSAIHRCLPSVLGFEMSDDSGVQFTGARTKRTHRVMAAENDRDREAAWEDYFHPPPSDYDHQSTSSPHRSRRPGYDYRRPAMTSPQENAVIDLTNESEDPPQAMRPPFPGRFGLPPPRRQRIYFRRDPMSRDSPVDTNPPVIDLEAEPPSDPSGDVLYVGTSSRRPDPDEPRFLDFDGIPMDYRATQGPRPGSPGHDPRRELMALQHLHEGFLSAMASMPGGLDYRSRRSAFNSPFQLISPPPQEIYKPPTPAPEGFTRNFSEDSMPTCPNCKGELGAGEGLKRQIYVAKSCGHVYCGECASNRSISKSKKAASKSKPFSKCQAAGCNKPVSAPTAMYQLYL
ncbi:uncharacterized protein N7515_009719 [Penicillium bovifimosum]|uniref:RING-type domain-containing protein n=1 Tax=Penicillium bovifimosum TaxID=126998 RepID=A0A9W9GHG5_9EURO|nr:uncharacterized protein N7515_009719 [Penicillium bovifimosum]KAJ5120331.1 hypothetical protein N7515_009719 [Penicillium bovifimosum]